ncbi:hypothetical protein ACWD11_32145 [Streptomyces sp. NPDC002776]
MTKLLLLIIIGAASAALVHAVRPALGPAPMAALQAEESRRFALLCRRAS